MTKKKTTPRATLLAAAEQIANDEQIFTLARAIVSVPHGLRGYSDVGEALVRYLSDEITADQTLNVLDHLATDYARARARSKS